MYDSYVRRLNYPKRTQGQLSRLLTYASSKRLMPFYVIYTPTDPTDGLMCRGGMARNDAGIYMLSASMVKAFADGRFGTRVSLGTLLRHSNPFHCIFCCRIGSPDQYFDHYFPERPDGVSWSAENLPMYVQHLLNSESHVHLEEWPTELASVKAVGVYDLRREE